MGASKIEHFMASIESLPHQHSQLIQNLAHQEAAGRYQCHFEVQLRAIFAQAFDQK